MKMAMKGGRRLQPKEEYYWSLKVMDRYKGFFAYHLWFKSTKGLKTCPVFVGQWERDTLALKISLTGSNENHIFWEGRGLFSFNRSGGLAHAGYFWSIKLQLHLHPGGPHSPLNWPSPFPSSHGAPVTCCLVGSGSNLLMTSKQLTSRTWAKTLKTAWRSSLKLHTGMV